MSLEKVDLNFLLWVGEESKKDDFKKEIIFEGLTFPISHYRENKRFFNPEKNVSLNIFFLCDEDLEKSKEFLKKEKKYIFVITKIELKPSSGELKPFLTRKKFYEFIFIEKRRKFVTIEITRIISN